MARPAEALPVRTQTSACGRDLQYSKLRVQTPDGICVAVQDWTPAGGTSLPGVLFIHGFSQCHGAWLKQVTSSLAQSHRLVTYDLRGHGDSDKPTDPVFYRESSRWAEEVHAVISRSGLVKPVVVAWSYAGRVILDYLGRFGDAALGGLVMVDATSTADPDYVGSAAPLMRQMSNSDPSISADATRSFLKACVARPLPADEFEYIYRFNMAVPSKIRSNLGGREAYYEETLRGLSLPTLVMHGELDPVTLPGMSAYTAAQVKGACALTYTDCAHMLFWESPQRFNEELAEFVRTTRR